MAVLCEIYKEIFNKSFNLDSKAWVLFTKLPGGGAAGSEISAQHSCTADMCDVTAHCKALEGTCTSVSIEDSCLLMYKDCSFLFHCL